MKNIYLIGMPSSGKSTLGRSLARVLNYRFVDMDDLIESHEGKTIFDIFKEKGEDYFRNIESQILKSIDNDSRLVIATGGGVPCFFDNMKYIKANGKSVFLDVKPEALFQRLINAKGNNRPLIDKTDHEALLENLKNRYQNRLPFYQQADFIAEGNIRVEELAEWFAPQGC
jgi:shikimate kinase